MCDDFDCLSRNLLRLVLIEWKHGKGLKGYVQRHDERVLSVL